MRPEKSPAVSAQQGAKTYRISSSVHLTQRQSDDGQPEGAFAKLGTNGRLFKLGAEEYFLLTKLDEGLRPERIAALFHAAFGKNVREDIIARFAKQMFGAGVLRLVTPEELDAAKAQDTETPPEPEPANTPAPTEQPDDPLDINDEVDDLERMVFGADAPIDDPAKEVSEDTPEETPDDTPEQAAEDKADAPDPVAEPAQDEPAKDTPPKGSAGPQGAPRFRTAEQKTAQPKAAPPSRSADPKIANRKVKFERNAGADDKVPSGSILRLFDPKGMHNLLWGLFGWTRHFSLLLYPLTVFALLVVFNRLTEFGLELMGSLQSFSRVGILLTSFLTVNLINTLVTGTVAQRRGARVRSFGLMFFLFIVPRFSVDLSRVQGLEKADKLAVYAASLKSRLFLFCAATIIWIVTRRSGTAIPDIALIVEFIAGLTFVMSAIPIFSGDGYKWLSTYFDQPFLRQRAFYQVFGTSKKIAERLPEPTPAERKVFTLYAVLAGLAMAALGSLLLIYVTTALEGRFGGTGLVLFAGLAVLCVVWMKFMTRGQMELRRAAFKEQMGEKMAERRAQKARPGAAAPTRAEDTVDAAPVATGRALVPTATRGTALVPGSKGEVGFPRGTAVGRPLPGVYADNAPKNRRRRWLTRLAMVCALGGLIYVGLLPYDYQVGGDFEILPESRTSVTVEVAGSVVEVLVEEGDVIEKGQLLARLSDHQPKFQYASAQAELEQAKGQLQKLLQGPLAEDVQVAREQVAAAEAELPFAKSQAERAEVLLERGAISDAEADRFRLAYVIAQQDLVTAQANLARTEAPSQPADIAIAEAQIAKIEAQLALAKTNLDRVTITAPVSGRVVTENADLVLGRYLDVGDLFVEIEDHTLGRAEVRVSETDIGLVTLGDTVRLKAWASTDNEWDGQVTVIAPLAEEEELGKVIRVITQFDNAEGFYRPGMTGFAKIHGAEMATWQAFTRLFDRFFRIEVWGWIP